MTTSIVGKAPLSPSAAHPAFAVPVFWLSGSHGSPPGPDVLRFLTHRVSLSMKHCLANCPASSPISSITLMNVTPPSLNIPTARATAVFTTTTPFLFSFFVLFLVDIFRLYCSQTHWRSACTRLSTC